MQLSGSLSSTFSHSTDEDVSLETPFSSSLDEWSASLNRPIPLQTSSSIRGKIIKVMYTNIDTFLNKREELQARLVIADTDILGLAEMLPKKKMEFNSCEYNIRNYSLFMGLNPKRGVAIYVKDKHKVQSHVFPHSDFEEATWCIIQLDKGDKLLVGVMYRRSPNSSPSNNLSLLKLLDNVADSNCSHILMMGDFNYRGIDWVNNTSQHGSGSDTTEFMETVQTLGWYQHVNQNTRFRQGDTPSLLDLVLTNEEDRVVNLMFDSPVGKSDHVVITFQYDSYGKNMLQKQKLRFI